MDAFNGDHLIWNEFVTLFKKFDVSVIFETGTYKAQSTIDFARLGVPVHTVESKKEYHTEALRNIQEEGVDNILSHLGDSPSTLRTVVPGLLTAGHRILFFLDAHWYGDNCLKRELMTLADMNFGTEKPIILIHDIKVPGHPEFGYDTYGGIDYEFSWMKSYIDKIFAPGKYAHWYNTGVSDQALHHRGCLFVASSRP